MTGSPVRNPLQKQEQSYDPEPSPSQNNNSSSFFLASSEATPSVVKSEGRTLLKRLDSSNDDVSAAEDLHSLCLFAKNRQYLLDTGILAALVLALKTKSDRVKEVIARTLQLFAQDGGEANCVALKRLNMCNSSLEMLGKTDDTYVQIPIVGLIYWLAQNPKCKKEFIDLGATAYLKDLNTKTKDPVLSKYLNYAINALSPQVKSREEMLDEILAQPVTVQSVASDNFESFNPYSTPSPRHFMSLFKSPKGTMPKGSPSSASYAPAGLSDSYKKLEFGVESTPQKQ